MINTLLLAIGIWFSMLYLVKLAQQFHPTARKTKGYSINAIIAIITWCTMYYLTHK